MTQAARLYGGSLYDLAAEEQLTEDIGEQMTRDPAVISGKPRLYKAVVRAVHPESGADRTDRQGVW